MDPDMHPIELTDNVSNQCTLWNCLIVARQSGYCFDSCKAKAIAASNYTRPCELANFYSPPRKFAPVASKIINALKTGMACGVPHLSPDLLKTAPWDSNVFNVAVMDPRVDFLEWLFIGPNKIPHSTTDFKWKQGRTKTVDGVRHCVFKPNARGEGEKRWKLNQYSSSDLIGKAVYVIHYKKIDN